MRILLVEDNLSLAGAIRSILAGAGYAVDTVHDGVSAEALARAEPFDLVILDLGLPEMDGLSVLRALRDRRDDAAVLILTVMLWRRARWDSLALIASLARGGSSLVMALFLE